jgi:sugar O-acyltransferase (sialic acid O-acetyltransferase NeuD family)
MEDIQYNNKKDVVILGAGSLGREILSWIESSKVESDLNIIGFLDDQKKDLLDYSISLPVLGVVDSCNLIKYPFFIIGMLNSDIRQNLFSLSREYGITAVTYLHETVLVGSRSKLGEGLIMMPNSLVSCDVTLGNHVFINNGSQVGHDVTVGDFTCIMANVDIGGGAQIGKNVFIGSKAVILPGVKIPDNSRIGAGAVVIRSIKQAGSYFGNPAKKIF